MGSGLVLAVPGATKSHSNELVCTLWTSVSSCAQQHTMTFPNFVDKQLCYVTRGEFLFAWHEGSHFSQLVYHG